MLLLQLHGSLIWTGYTDLLWLLINLVKAVRLVACKSIAYDQLQSLRCIQLPIRVKDIYLLYFCPIPLGGIMLGPEFNP